MTRLRNLFALLLFVAVFHTACDRPINVFTVSQDKQLGAQLEQEIASNPTEYPLLDETQYATAYTYLLAMRDEILASPEVKFKDEFEWKLKIINDDSVLNAFCAPGGYIYVYTGLMKYLDKVDHLAGVLAHEIAHADQRHSTASMTEQYGLETLIAIASNNATAAQLGQVAGSLAQLGFSRAHETDADEHSVDYLHSTKYACNGAAGFFAKLIAQGQTSGTPAFLSTHPDPGNRVTKINERATELGCSTTLYHDNGDQGAYAAMLATLP
ncbi:MULTISPECIES: M48 family metalloprotease [unclassified Aureispira]|uniref:M48 family metalloprotease n=1 Tax=unclassified Aureispira TaxID=2649989 RepID=UPI000697D2A3|nr:MULTISPECIES: M48 family metalloprotease [unclassified Aureispira]WMX15050.1 M48 family metalloprotease [Aureispira sp. CCB-E]